MPVIVPGFLDFYETSMWCSGQELLCSNFTDSQKAFLFPGLDLQFYTVSVVLHLGIYLRHLQQAWLCVHTALHFTHYEVQLTPFLPLFLIIATAITFLCGLTSSR